MNTEIIVLLSQRLRAERNRLGLSQAEMAERGGVKPRTYQDWERGVSTVAAGFLMVMGQQGLDVIYVMTGTRGEPSSLSAEEQALLDNYRAAKEEGRAAARAVLASVEKQPPTAPGRKSAGSQ